jgi:hypothetical protein
MIWPRSQNFKIGHDGILSIGNFILMLKNHILIFQLPGNWPTTKKCAPFFRGNTEFSIYFWPRTFFPQILTVNLSLWSWSSILDCWWELWGFDHWIFGHVSSFTDSISLIRVVVWVLIQLSLLLDKPGWAMDNFVPAKTPNLYKSHIHKNVSINFLELSYQNLS